MSENAYGAEWSLGLRRGSDAELRSWLSFALACCDEADPIALGSYRTDQRIDTKPDGSFVTEADQAIERLIRGRIETAFPEHGVVGEEFGNVAAGSDVRWYLDPIDGTHNFMRGVPLFGTLLAVERDGELQAAVISAPALGQRWYAHRGGGAWTVGGPAAPRPRPIHVSTVTDLAAAQVLFRAVTDMRVSRVATGFERLLEMVWRDRGFGDFWGYTLVADGGAEAMMEQDLGPWDLAAPWLIVEEAGGRITDFDGQRSIARGEGLATNGALHETILAVLNDRDGDHALTPAEPRPPRG
jgi:histidinol-phosphatase